MKLVHDDLFNFNGDFLLVTTNSTIKKDGSLVMGRGAAYQASQWWDDLPLHLGTLIRNHPRYGRVRDKGYPMLDYGLLFVKHYQGVTPGAFQVKYHWRGPAEIHLISFSTSRLTYMAQAMPEHTFALNFPGIGNGRLNREDVLPIIETLPDNVYVYEK